MNDRSDDSSHHERTLLQWSYITIQEKKKTNILRLTDGDCVQQTAHQTGTHTTGPRTRRTLTPLDRAPGGHSHHWAAHQTVTHTTGLRTRRSLTPQGCGCAPDGHSYHWAAHQTVTHTTGLRTRRSLTPLGCAPDGHSHHWAHTFTYTDEFINGQFSVTVSQSVILSYLL